MDSRSTHQSLLLRLAEGGDSLAWFEFQDQYGDLIRSFAKRRGLQPADCDDVMQEVLLSLSRALPGFRYDPARGRFRSYLKAAVVRGIHRKTCQKAGEISLESVAGLEDARREDAAWEAEWRNYHVRRALKRLGREFSERDHAAFMQYAIEGRSVTDTAAALGMTEEHVYQVKSRFLRRIRKLVEEQVEQEG